MAHTFNTSNKKSRWHRVHSHATAPHDTNQSRAEGASADLLREHAIREQEARRVEAVERRQFLEDRKQYHLYRNKLKRLHSHLSEIRFGSIDETYVKACYAQLGFPSDLKNCALSEVEFNVFVDYAYYVHRPTDTAATIMEQYAALHQATECDLERQMITALNSVEFTILHVGNVIAPGARRVINWRTMQAHILRDESLARHEHHLGFMMAANILHFPHFIMTTGAPLPLGDIIGDSPKTLQRLISQCLDSHEGPEAVRSTSIARLLKYLLAAGSAERVVNEDL